MNDTKLADAVRSGLAEACDSLNTVHLAIPASEIMARADMARRRRRLGVLAGAGGAAAVAVAVSVALPAGHLTASHPAASHTSSGPGARLAAWTVTRQSDGSIQVSFFRQLRFPVALQRTLRADGVPASVTFIGRQNPACHPYPVASFGQPIARALRDGHPPGGPLSKVLGGPFSHPQRDAMVIHPAALPSGAGLQIAVMRGIPPGPAGPWPYPKGSGHPVTEVGLVKASPQCTGT
jgi:hypothetical protein